jgi:hypothetical protein
MNTTNYGEFVRVRTEGSKTMFGEDFEVVEELKSQYWAEVKRFGHMSNDHAYGDARRLAQALARNHIGGH